MQKELGWGVAWLMASVLFGCASRVAESDGLLAELAQSRQQALLSDLRLAELERRVVELQNQAELRWAAPDRGAGAQAQILQRLDLLVTQNQLLLEHAGAVAQPDPFDTGVAPSAAPAPCQEPRDPEEQLRRSVERLREDPTRWRGGLTPAQNEAVNLLLRRKRALDTNNPWSS